MNKVIANLRALRFRAADGDSRPFRWAARTSAKGVWSKNGADMPPGPVNGDGFAILVYELFIRIVAYDIASRMQGIDAEALHVSIMLALASVDDGHTAEQVVTHVHGQLREALTESGAIAGACVATADVFFDGSGNFAHLGDISIFLVRMTPKPDLRRINVLQHGLNATQLLQCAGMPGVPTIEVGAFEMRRGDMLLMNSDGMGFEPKCLLARLKQYHDHCAIVTLEEFLANLDKQAVFEQTHQDDRTAVLLTYSAS